MERNTYKKYFTATLATAIAVSGVAATAPTEVKANTSFPDVSTNNMFYKEITSLAERGIIKGYPDGKFHPGDNITRGQAAIIIAGVLGLDTVNVSNPGFNDVSTTSYYYGPIAAMANEGIINGYGDKSFKPSDPITRTEMAIMMSRAFNLNATPGFKTPFKDIEGNKYKNYISALYENGITKGVSKTRFDGQSNVSRGQLAAFVVRAENQVAEKEEVVSFDILEVSSNQLKATDGSTYKISSTLKGLLNKSNSAPLQQATIQAVVKNSEIISIEVIQLNANGSREAFVTLDGQNTTFTGTLTVNADYVQVKNLTVNGDVILTNKVVNAFDADGFKTTGELIIKGTEPVAVASLTSVFAKTTTSPKINLQNTTINKINAQRNNIVIDSNTKLPEIVVSAKVTSIQVDADVSKFTVEVEVSIKVTGTGNIDEIAVEKAQAIALEVAGQVAKLAVADTTAKVDLGVNVKIETVVVPEGSQVSSIISNYDAVKSNISKVETPSGENVTPSVNPPSTNDDSNSGNSGSNQNPTPQFTATTNNETANDVATLGLVGTSATSNATNVATVAIVNGKIAITSVSAGTAIITIKNAENHIATIPVTIASNGAITLGTITKYVSQPVVTASSELAKLTAKTEVTVDEATEEKIKAELVSGFTVAPGYQIEVAEYNYNAESGTVSYKLVVTNGDGDVATSETTSTTTVKVDAGEPNLGLPEHWISLGISKGDTIGSIKIVTNLANEATKLMYSINEESIQTPEYKSAVPGNLKELTIDKDITEDVKVGSFVAVYHINDKNEVVGFGQVIIEEKDIQLDQATDTFEVTLNVDGQTSTLTTDANGKVTLPANPTKAGYTFVGWNTQADGKGTEVTTDTVFTEDTTVYAIFQADEEETVTAVYKNTDESEKTAYIVENGGVFVVPTVTATINDEAAAVTALITDEADNVIESLDTTKAGTYTITYTADGADNSFVITVTVKAAPVDITSSTKGEHGIITIFVEGTTAQALEEALSAISISGKTSLTVTSAKDELDNEIANKYVVEIQEAANDVVYTLVAGEGFAISPDVTKQFIWTENVVGYTISAAEGENTDTKLVVSFTESVGVDGEIQNQWGSIIGKDGATVATSLAEGTTLTIEISNGQLTNGDTVIIPLTVNGAEVYTTFAWDSDKNTWTISGDGLTLSELPKPNNLLIDSGNQSASLSWDSVTGATGYNIYRSTSVDGTYQKIASNHNETAYHDTALGYAQTYYYYVQPVSGAVEGPQSETMKIVTNLDQIGPKINGDYGVISNESTDVTNNQSTGPLSAKMQLFSMPKALEHEAYRINPTIPLVEENMLSNRFSLQGSLNIQTTNNYQLNDTETFKVNNRANNQFYDIEAVLLYEGTHSQVWVHNNSLTQAQAAQLGQEFDNNIYNPIVDAFGAPTDKNLDGKVAILCYDIQDNFNGPGTSYVGGYFSGNDLLNNDVSNGMEIFYIDTYPSMGTDKNNLDVSKVYSTLAHEFQHMINFSHDWFSEGNQESDNTLMETWLNEGLSMAAEQLYLEHVGSEERVLTSRINYYNQSESIKNGHSLLNWNDNGDVLSNYSLSYLFIQYLRIQAGQGHAIYKEIIEHEKGNYEAVEAVIKKYIDPTMTFGEFMTAFRIAMVVKADSGLYGFGGETGFNALATKLYTGGTKNLSGGSAIIIAPGTNGLDDTEGKGPDVNYTGIFK